MRTHWKVILLPGLLAAWLCCAGQVVADTAGIVDVSVMDDGLSDLPPAGLEGWFMTFDPSNQWTSAENIATMESWLAMVARIFDDPSLLAGLNGLGMNDPLAANNFQMLLSEFPPQQSVVPEPATLGLLGGALSILLLCSCKRAQSASGSTYVSLRRFDRSRRN